MNNIYFYSWKDKYFEFSNFSNHPIMINGYRYPTNEHYFQAMKFVDKKYSNEIRLAKTPAEAKRMGLSRQYEIHSDWDEKRIEVMRVAVQAKFEQHKDLKKLLLDTYPMELIEDSPTDYFWGCGFERTGKNMLGVILQDIRDDMVIDVIAREFKYVKPPCGGC